MLTVINGYSSLLMNRSDLDPEMDEAFKEINQAGQRSANLTRQLLAFSRKQNPVIARLSLNETVENLSKMLRRVIGEDISLVISLDPRLPDIQADVAMIEQVLVNLAVNSRDAMAGGGKLVIKTEEVSITEDHVRAHLSARAGNFVRLTVQDGGCGMSPDVQAHIFEPFFTTKSVGKGTGLGLATVFGIVQQHEGWIEVESQEGLGTTFHVFLPVDPGVPADVASLPSPQSPMYRGTGTILLVEDELVVRSLTRKILEGLGYAVLEAGSGVEALWLWENHCDTIDLLITDMVLPKGVNGLELAERLEAGRPGLRVIYSSGYSLNALGSKMVLEDGINFLQKPYSPERLASAVRKRLEHPAPKEMARKAAKGLAASTFKCADA